MPQMMLMSVVLPAPFGPKRAKISPLSIVRFVAVRAWTPLAYDLVSSTMEIMDGIDGRSSAVTPP